ncbi:MAG TPA: hypothetical protein VFX82_15510 [Desulfobacterales bacterium]|nr:hypothetical protein [Desulfobacterales bacterium]
MSDSKKSDPKRPSIELPDDEPVIDLVDEVSGGPTDGDLSDLEKNLLTLDRSFARGLEKTDENLRIVPELPDLDDLNGFDFEEEDAELPASGTLPPAAAKEPLPDGTEPELDWLLDEVAFAPAADPAHGRGGMDNDVTEISEFDEQFMDAEEVLDDPPAAEVESDDVNDDETLELLDLDDDEIDNELVWFDDIDKPPAHGGVAQAEQAAVAPVEPAGSRPFSDVPASDTTAADLFDAFVQSGRPVGGDAPESAGPLAAAAAPLAAMPVAAALSQSYTVDVSQPPAANTLTEDQIEAAVERVITRMYAGTIETVIRQAIEKAVLKEIERLKNHLLENDLGDKIP